MQILCLIFETEQGHNLRSFQHEQKTNVHVAGKLQNQKAFAFLSGDWSKQRGKSKSNNYNKFNLISNLYLKLTPNLTLTYT